MVFPAQTVNLFCFFRQAVHDACKPGLQFFLVQQVFGICCRFAPYPQLDLVKHRFPHFFLPYHLQYLVTGGTEKVAFKGSGDHQRLPLQPQRKENIVNDVPAAIPVCQDIVRISDQGISKCLVDFSERRRIPCPQAPHQRLLCMGK